MASETPSPRKISLDGLLEKFPNVDSQNDITPLEASFG